LVSRIAASVNRPARAVRSVFSARSSFSSFDRAVALSRIRVRISSVRAFD